MLSELLLSRSLDINLAFKATMPTLLARADAVAMRQSGWSQHDSEYLYSVFKLLHRIGTSSRDGHGCVMGCKDQWQYLRRRFLTNRTNSSGQYISVQAAQNQPVAAMAQVAADRQMYGFSLS